MQQFLSQKKIIYEKKKWENEIWNALEVNLKWNNVAFVWLYHALAMNGLELLHVLVELPDRYLFCVVCSRNFDWESEVLEVEKFWCEKFQFSPINMTNFWFSFKNRCKIGTDFKVKLEKLPMVSGEISRFFSIYGWIFTID